MMVISGKVIRRLETVIVGRDEQYKIVDRLKSVDVTIDAIQQDLVKLRQQKLGLMHDLLTDKVRVPNKV